MCPNLLQALQVFTQFVVETVGKDLREFAVDDVFLTVKEPVGDFVLAGVLDDGDDAFELVVGEFTGAINREPSEAK